MLGHQTPLSGEHFRLNGCPVSLDHCVMVRYRRWAKGFIRVLVGLNNPLTF